VLSLTVGFLLAYVRVAAVYVAWQVFQIIEAIMRGIASCFRNL
jgi:hypothetical protein